MGGTGKQQGMMTRHSKALITTLGGVAAVLLIGLPALSAQTYTVRQGDSAWKIAKRLGVSTATFLAANHLTERSVLHPGQSLVVPERGQAQAGSAPAPGKPTTYTVKRGDTLGAIARRHGLSVAALARENGITNPHRIRAGRTLRMPSASAARGRPAPPNTAGAENASGSALVDTALGYRGVPYRWAGMTTRGMDCSGLVARVLLSHGIRAPHSSRELYKLGTAVSRDQLQAGDLVFFNTRGRGISHVGIYMGDGKFVHASSSGGKVKTDRLDTGYYQRRYVGARRVM